MILSYILIICVGGKVYKAMQRSVVTYGQNLDYSADGIHSNLDLCILCILCYHS